MLLVCLQVNQQYVQVPEILVSQVASIKLYFSLEFEYLQHGKNTLGQKTANLHVKLKRASTRARAVSASLKSKIYLNWHAENFGDKVSEMVFLRDFESCQACIDEHKTGCLDIHNKEPGDPKDDTQYVGIHGAFTTQEHQNLVRDHRLKEESNSMHQFLSKWLASINMNMKERRT